MKTEITKIEWLEDNKMSFSWIVTCNQGEEQPDDHYLLLYKPLSDCNGTDKLPPLRPEDDEVLEADLFCEATGKQKSCKKSIKIEKGQVVFFTIYPLPHGGNSPYLNAGSSKCAFVGRKSKVGISLKYDTESCTRVCVHSECSLGYGEIRLRIKEKEYELPFSLASAGDGSAVFLSRLQKSDIEPRLTGKAQWKCVWEWKD